MRKPEDAIGLGNVSRRDFGLSIAGLGIAGALAKTTPSLAQSPGEERGPQNRSSGPECDLLIKGGTVIDPSQNLHAKLDVAVKEGKILEVSRGFPEDRAVNVLSAKDKIVTPGLVDLLAHLFEGVSVSAPYGGADINSGKRDDHSCGRRFSRLFNDCWISEVHHQHLLHSSVLAVEHWSNGNNC